VRALQLSLVVLAAVCAGATSLEIKPTTTLAIETGNNTSAANSWTTSSNGNLGASNVSKVDHRTLLYPGATTQIYSNIMYWFGPSNHIQVGYKSNDYNQVKKQVDDHLSRGINGTIVDWYGTGHSWDNGATLYLKQYAETLPGYPFKFAIMEDKGALSACLNTAGCDLTAQLISDLTYIVNTYGVSPAYMKINGQPVIFFFGVEALAIDWNRVLAGVPGNPLYIFENSSGFTRVASSGGFAWVMINSTNQLDWKQSYLDPFYTKALTYPAEHTFGATYKGFNDTAASWSLNRIMSQQCGQVWLNTWKEASKYYSAGNQLEAMQIVTWNDYEEGTEIESGIDNCLSISASVSGNTLSWTVSGNENTLDHYVAFVSTDGQNLMTLANISTGISSLDLGQFGLGPGSYTLFVKAVGKPSIVNHMSPAVSFSVADQPPEVALSVTPSGGIAPATVTASTAGSTDDIGITFSTLDFGDGMVVNATSATHVYSTPGTYTVTGTVYDAAGHAVSKSATVVIVPNQPPLAALSVTPATGSVALIVTASTAASTDPDGSIVASTIDFGDGTVAVGPTAAHMYIAAGKYVVKATVTDNLGASSVATVTVNASPPAGVSVAMPLNGGTVVSPVRMVATALSPNTITAMRIYVDSQSLYTVNASALDTSLSLAPGTRNVVIQAWDATGAVFKAPLTITVAAPNQPPAASLTVSASAALAGTPITAALTGSDPDGTIAACRIDFGDGSVASTSSATHAYSVAGTYLIRGTVTDNSGATATAVATVTITTPPAGGVKIAAPADGATVGSPVHFIATATPADSSRPIRSIRIYVDGISRYLVYSNRVDTYLVLARGAHSVVIQAWDSGGTVYKATETVTVR
jgi:PKD repeat protein